ncbi:MAG: clan AA aspartic protease [Candidatus Aenigmarchaeota archaeon]|nr:clan AA aspartic protease [Candidatus Aenigmarchaeota archaeon]
MGHTIVDIEISDMNGKHSEKVKALVDTGATLTTLPKQLADKLGIEPIRTEYVRTGAGIVKLDRGRAYIKLCGKEDAFSVWISDFIDKVLLGVVVLQSLGFEVDPTTEKLKPVPLLLY